MCVWGGGGGGKLGILGGGVPPGSPILTLFQTPPRPQGFSLKKRVDPFFKGKALGTRLFQTKNVIFHARFQTRPLKSIRVFRPGF